MSAKAGVHRGARASRRLTWSWHDDAQCWGEDLALFFGPDGERQPERDVRERKAKAICAQCPVRAECLDYALSRPEKYGLYGGMSEEERANARRREARRTAPPTPAPCKLSKRDAGLYEASILLMDRRKLPMAVAAERLRVSDRELRSIRRRGRQAIRAAEVTSS